MLLFTILGSRQLVATHGNEFGLFARVPGSTNAPSPWARGVLVVDNSAPEIGGPRDPFTLHERKGVTGMHRACLGGSLVATTTASSRP